MVKIAIFFLVFFVDEIVPYQRSEERRIVLLPEDVQLGVGNIGLQATISMICLLYIYIYILMRMDAKKRARHTACVGPTDKSVRNR